MYGVDNSLMDRMERRIRQKIYRQMIEQEQNYNRANQQEKTNQYQIRNRNKTQPTNHYSHQTRKNTPKYSRNNDQLKYNLEHQSTFLPIITSKRYMKEQPVQQQQPNRNQSYQRYRKSKLNIQSRNHGRNRSTNVVQDSDDQKTQLYLQQCERIIGSLKQLTNRNSKKIRPKRNIYDIQADSPHYKSLSTSKNQMSSRQEDYSKTYRMVANRNHEPPKILAYDLDKKPSPSQYSWPADKTENKSHLKGLQNQVNQFNQNSNVQSPSLANIKMKENLIKISPPAISNLDKNNKIEESQRQDQQFEEYNHKKQSKSPMPPQKKTKERLADKPKIDKQAEKPKKEKVRQENAEQDNLQNQQKRQKMIVKYLKKARLRGNQLYQKIQSRKNENSGVEPQGEQYQQS